jgi:hypothetical protein
MNSQAYSRRKSTIKDSINKSRLNLNALVAASEEVDKKSNCAGAESLTVVELSTVILLVVVIAAAVAVVVAVAVAEAVAVAVGVAEAVAVAVGVAVATVDGTKTSALVENRSESNRNRTVVEEDCAVVESGDLVVAEDMLSSSATPAEIATFLKFTKFSATSA